MERKSLKENTIYNMLKTFANMIFPLITFPYVSRVLLPETVGKYNFASTYVNYFALFASLGVSTYAIRECSKIRNNKKKLEEVSSQIFSINIITMFISYVGLFFSIFFINKLEDYKLLIIVFSFTIFFNIVGMDWMNTAFEDFKYITIRAVVFQIISLVLLLVFVKKPEDYIIYAIITVISSTGASICNIFYRRKYCKIRFTFKTNWKKHFPPIVLLFVMILVQTVFSNSDIIMLGMMKNDYQVGLYSTAVRIYNILNQLLAAILWVMLPRLSLFYAEKQYNEINQLLNKNLQFMIGLGLPIISGVCLTSKEILLILGGDKYLGAAPLLVLLMIALFFSLLGGNFLGNMIMLPSKREKQYLYACIVAAVANIILNYIFIPKYGSYAAALTTIVAHIIILVMLCPCVKKIIRIESLGKIFIAPVFGCVSLSIWCIIIKKIVSSMWISFVMSVAGSIVIYAVVLYLFKYKLYIEILQQLLEKVKKRPIKRYR